MPREPLRFLSEMNKLSIAMSASAFKTGAKRTRRKILRQMKTLLRKIECHAKAHLRLLAHNLWVLARRELAPRQSEQKTD